MECACNQQELDEYFDCYLAHKYVNFFPSPSSLYLPLFYIYFITYVYTHSFSLPFIHFDLCSLLKMETQTFIVELKGKEFIHPGRLVVITNKVPLLFFASSFSVLPFSPSSSNLISRFTHKVYLES